MESPRVRCRWINEVCQTQLPQMKKTLKLRRLCDRDLVGVQPYIFVRNSGSGSI